MEALIIAGAIAALSLGLLIFGFGTGHMPSLIVGLDDADREEAPGRFWTLAAVHSIWLVAALAAMAGLI